MMVMYSSVDLANTHGRDIFLVWTFIKVRLQIRFRVTCYTEIRFFVGYTTLVQGFLVMQHISVNPLSTWTVIYIYMYTQI